MLATAQRQAFPAPPPAPGWTPARVPDAVFHAAYRELCTQLWLELEIIAQSIGADAGQATADAAMSAAILRLELVVLVDACRSARWRSMLLAAHHCDRMCSMLTDVLAALYVDVDELRAGLAAAEERLVDELHAESDGADQPGPGRRTPVEEPLSDAEVDSLIGFVQEHARAMT